MNVRRTSGIVEPGWRLSSHPVDGWALHLSMPANVPMVWMDRNASQGVLSKVVPLATVMQLNPTATCEIHLEPPLHPLCAATWEKHLAGVERVTVANTATTAVSSDTLPAPRRSTYSCAMCTSEPAHFYPQPYNSDVAVRLCDQHNVPEEASFKARNELQMWRKLGATEVFMRYN